MKQASKSSLWLVLASAFTVGSVVMSLEMLASRYLNPYFGGTIFTWAALISIVLLAMMLGYFAGGYSADKIKFSYVLESSIILAALYLLALPFFVDPLLEAVIENIEDVKLGALIGAFIITAPPVACLSTFTPIAIGRTLSNLDQTGRISGTIFAISTFGNIFGTLLTSFYLIPNFGTRNLTQSLALVLLLAVVLCFLARRKQAAIAMMVAILAGGAVLNAPTEAVAKSPIIFTQKAAYPEGPVFIKGALYYAEMTRNRVMKVAWDVRDTKGLRDTREKGAGASPFYYERGCGPTSLAAFGNDKIVILCHLSDALKIVDYNGKLLQTIRRSKANIKIFHPNDCIKDKKGGVYITAPGHFDKKYQPMGLLFYLKPSGEVIEIADKLTYPNGIAIHKGQLYVAEHLANRVIKFPIKADGTVGSQTTFTNFKTAPRLNKKLPSFPLPRFSGPDGIEISKQGTIYIAHYGAGRIWVYSTDGTFETTIHTRPQFVTNMALAMDGKLVITGANTLGTALQEGEVYSITP